MARTTSPPPTTPGREAPAEELDRLERRALTDAAALQDLRDECHNASVAVAQASGDQLHAALTRKRDLERQLDELLAESAPVIARVKILRATVAADRRALLVARLREAGAQFTAAVPACEAAFADAFAHLATLLTAAKATTERARGCGADTLTDITSGLQLAQLKAWLLTQIDAAGLAGISAATMPYDPHQHTPGVTPTEAAADLALRLETTR